MADAVATHFSLRSPDSFGVAGALDEKCRVYYCNLFTPHQIGRVSDLIAAQLRPAGYDELRLRALLLFGVFEGYSTRAGAAAASGFAHPVRLECGVDSDRLAVGVNLEASAGAEPVDPEALPRRVRSGEPEGELERFLTIVRPHCDRLVVRAHHTSRRIEVVALVGKGVVAEAAAGAEVEVVLLPDGPVAEAPAAERYVELGDLDHGRLLSANETVSGDAANEDDSERVISGKKKKDRDGVVRISGTTDHLNSDDSRQVVKGDGEQTEEDETRIAGGAGGIGNLLRKIWPFSRGAEKSEDGSEEFEDEESQLLSTAELGEGEAKTEAESETESAGEGEAKEPAAGADEPVANAEATARRLMVELKGGTLDRTINKAQSEMGEIKRELKGKRAQRWAEGLMSELLTEKARLHEMARKLNMAVRQKEVEFRNKETGLKEEIRRRDESLRQKEHAIARTKDQVQQLRMALDRMKAIQVGAGDEVHYRQKYNLSQKLYSSAKEENTKIAAALDQLKAEVSGLRYSAKKGEEYKKQYLALAEKATDKQAGGVAANAAKRAETEAKMAAVYRKEAGDLRARLGEVQLKAEETEREEARLKKEVERLQSELKSAKGRRSGPTDGGAASGSSAA